MDANLIQFNLPQPLPTQNVEDMIAEVEMVNCTNALGAELVAAAFRSLAKMEFEAEEEHRRMRRPILQAIDGYWRPIRDRIAYGKKIAGQKLTAYTVEEERKREALALKAREDDRAQRERLAQEAAAREARAHEEAERLRREAQVHEKGGNSAAAAALSERAEHAEMAGAQDAQLLLEQVQTSLPAEIPDAHKPTGITTVYKWEGECVNLQELARACVEGRAPWSLLAVVQPELNRLAGALQAEFKVPGCVARRKPHVRRK